MAIEAKNYNKCDDRFPNDLGLIPLYGDQLGLFDILVPELIGNEQSYDMAVTSLDARLDPKNGTVLFQGISFSDLDDPTKKRLRGEVNNLKVTMNNFFTWFSDNAFTDDTRDKVWKRTSDYFCEVREHNPYLQQFKITKMLLAESQRGLHPHYLPYQVIKAGIQMAVIEVYLESSFFPPIQ